MNTTGAITGYIDVAQLVLYAFWIFFAGLIIYLRREDKREGYPLESERSEHIKVQGWPAMPAPKTFKLAHGGEVQAPSPEKDRRPIKAEPIAPFPGAALAPTGNPLADGVGPAAWGLRAKEPDLTFEGEPKIVPLRVATDYAVARQDIDPRGMAIVGADGVAAGTITDVWVDRSEPQVRFLEFKVAATGRSALVPIYFAHINAGRSQVEVDAILGSQFAGVPGLSNPDQVTLDEEDRISAYYGGGKLYAEPSREEPLL
ncbi:MAG: photosynthetic reaction center subunit H [Steroidobacteraceae bacterium]|jgi:photosynthetic reaction center H subunit|nr:photosynthetic reaction center subunit H [Steroidobacteraceae bacterium]